MQVGEWEEGREEGATGVNVLGFNFSSTSARRYSLNCIVHSQLLPIYSANAFCTNKLNQFNCPKGKGGKIGEGEGKQNSSVHLSVRAKNTKF